MSDTCQIKRGLYFDGAVPVADSLAGAWGCGEPATMTMRAVCACKHVRERRYCAGHGVISPSGGVWFCLPCAELGHDCPVTPEIIAAAAS